MKRMKINVHNKQVYLFLLLIILAAAIAVFVASCGGRAKEVSVEEELTTDAESKQVDYVNGIPMDENAGVVTECVADIYERPDVKSERITQALYNQPVRVIQRENGWAKVRAVDGNTGWMKDKYIDKNISSIYGRSFSSKIIVTSKYKEIYSSLSGGTTIIEAPMGTELLSFNTSGDASEVYLPGNKTGWIKGSGIIHLKPDETIPVTNANDFASTALRFKGAPYTINGRSWLGIDSPGLVYICARINGINLPSSIEGQLLAGIEIRPEDAQIGDLLFLAGTGEGEGDTVSCVGIYTGSGVYLYAGRKIGYVEVGDVNRENAEGVIVAARRIFY